MTFVTYITKVLSFLVVKLYRDDCFSLHNNISSKVNLLLCSVNKLNDFNPFCVQNSNLDEESLVTYVTVSFSFASVVSFSFASSTYNKKLNIFDH